MSAFQKRLYAKQKCLSTVILPVCYIQMSWRLFLDRWHSSCARTTFSRMLERNGRLETGLKFFKSFTSNPGFLKRGLTTAVFKQSSTMPVVREVFMILVITGTRTSWYCLERGGGTGSRFQIFEAVFKIS